MADIKIHITCNTVLEKSMTSYGDFGFKSVVVHNPWSEVNALMKLHLWNEEEDEFFFAELLFCKEINTMYITDLYGYNFHSFDEETEYYEPDDIRENVSEQLNSILRKMFPQYNQIKFFDIDEFYVDAYNYMQTVTDGASTLANVLPKLVVQSIINQQVPFWVYYQYYPRDLKAVLQLDNFNYATSYDFVHDNLVCLDMEY